MITLGPAVAARTLLAARMALACGLLLCLAATNPAYANGSGGQEIPFALPDLIPKLRQGGYVIYLRHAATDHDTDDINVDFTDCNTQRTLSEEGRQQATRIGEAFDKLAIPVGRVISSPFCRCKDTARLAFDRFEVNHDLHFAINVSEAERNRLATALREMLATAPEPGSNTVIVAHTANLKEAAGIWPKPEGVAFVFRPDGNHQFTPVSDKVLPKDWAMLVGKL